MADARGFAPAKVNLSLHVTGQRDDGLHLLDSLVAFADVGDHLTISPATASTLCVDGPMAAGVPQDARNLVLKAAAWMGETAAFTLEKHLPAAAGIGGGSSDAAAALRLLADLTGRPIPHGSEALGADVPVCLAPKATRMRGIGEALAPVALPPLPAVLVNPGVEVPTGAVFSALPTKENPPMPADLPRLSNPVQAADWLASQRNDLEAPAIAFAPVIGTLLDVLKAQPKLCLARMSGSGATCFGLFETQSAAENAANKIRAAFPAWWVVATKLG
ncbi:4-(cytidine 5'-diphospho)-2-C-methyl-D-erythritol kinase [Rhodobacteraceae bacterium D3-12]|nr:4-(cytidine 5'-diphospho)-2-C-methyl-D-erythritol kinase [Rhodobacteraceae bacterium D3-12]